MQGVGRLVQASWLDGYFVPLCLIKSWRKLSVPRFAEKIFAESIISDFYFEHWKDRPRRMLIPIMHEMYICSEVRWQFAFKTL